MYHIATRVMPIGLFESTYSDGPGVFAVFYSQPAGKRCSCGQSDCRHLQDAEDLLKQHHCPICGKYEPWSECCASCAWGLEKQEKVA